VTNHLYKYTRLNFIFGMLYIYMNLQNLTDPLPKPWLNINTNAMETNLMTLDNQTSVSNPTAGSIAVYSDNTGALSSRDSSGTVVTYTTSATFADSLLQVGPTTAGNFPMYVDSISNNVQDSGFGPNVFQLLIAGTTGLENQTKGIAPFGQRDLWQYPAVPPLGSGLLYLPELDIILSYANANFANAMYYSNDGGVNYTVCNFDVAPGGFLVPGWNGSLAVAVGQGGAVDSFTSVDGINWVKGPNPPATSPSFNINWFASSGLFITGNSLDAAHSIMTSPDGITWTSQLSNTQALTLKSNADIIVAVGQAAPFYQYSTDGIVWTDSLSPGLVGTRSLTYSDEKKEFVAIALSSTNGYVSSDGINWSALSSPFPAAGGLSGDSLLWVANNINRYYAAQIDSDGNYSLYSTVDANLPFNGTHLDGALNNPLIYSLIYLPSYERLIMGTNNAKAAYSTTRPLAIKSMSDDIRVRGNPVHVDQYSTYDNVLCDNTAVETNISTSVSSIGSLVYQDSQPLGMKINADLNLLVNSVGGDTLTIRYKVNGVTAFSHIVSVPALSVNLPININSKLVVRAATLQINSTQSVSGVVNTISSSSAAYTRTVVNTISVTAQWGLAASQCTMNSLTLDNMFRNGA
jgi:hypothetical protein